MNLKLKYLSASFAVIAMLGGGVVNATEVALDPVPAPNTQPAVVDDKGKDEALVAPVAPAGPALLSPADLLQLTEFINNMKAFRQTVKDLDGKSDAEREAALMHAILQQGGVAQQSTDLLATLIKKINIIVQGVNSAPDSKCRSCQVCFASAVHGADYAAQEFNKLFPLVDKYYTLITQVEQTQGSDAMAMITALVDAGVMKDLTYLLEFTDRYKAYEEVTKAKTVLKTKRSSIFSAKDSNPVPVQPVVKAAENPDKVEVIGGESVEPVKTAPATPVLTAEDIKQLTDFMAAIKEFRKQVKLNEGKDDKAREAALMEAILENGGLASESLGFLNTLAQKLNVAIQSIDAAPDSKMKKCQGCFQAATVGTTFGLDELNKVLPLVSKYYDLVNSIEARGSADAIDYMDEFIKAGVLKDLTYLVNFTERYKAYELNTNKTKAESKLAREQKRANLMAKRTAQLAKKADSAPKKVVVAPVAASETVVTTGEVQTEN